MKPQIIFFAILFFIMLVSTNADTPIRQHNLFELEEYEEYWLIKLICSHMSKKCTYDFVSIPNDWEERGQWLKIPIQDIQGRGQYTIIVNIISNDQNSKKKQIFVFLDNGKVDVITRDARQIQVQKLDSHHLSKDQPNIYGNLEIKNRDELSWLEQNGIKSYLPSIAHLDEIIIEGNSETIAKTIQNIVADKSDCSDKIRYLRDVISRIKEHLQFTEKSLKSQNNLHSRLELQFQQLDEERDRLVKELANTKAENKNALRQKEKQLQSQRSSAFSKHNSLSIIASKYLKKLQLFTGKTDEKIEKIKNQISSDEEELASIQSQIEELEQKKKKLQNKINSNKKKIPKTKTRNRRTQKRIASLRSKYEEYSEKSLKFQVQYKQAQKQLQYVREKLSNADDHLSTVKSQIQQVEKKLWETQKAKQDTHNQLTLHQIIMALQRNSQKLQNALKNCQQGLKEKKQEKYKEQKNFIITEKKKIDDLNDESIPPLESVKYLVNQYELVNMFSPNWIIEYGVPSPFSFSCDDQTKYEKGYGIITAVQKGAIRVRNVDGSIKALHIGRCSSLLAEKEDFVPVTGDLIEWQGNQIVSGIINLHQAHLFRKQRR